MRRQLDIFGSSKDADREVGRAGPSRAKSGKRKLRSVKKAPLIVDSYAADELRVTSHESRPESVPEPIEEKKPHVLSVSEITDLIKGNLETSFQDIWVTGEVTNFKGRKGPHAYFALKDESSQINAIIFGAGNGRLRFELQDGLKLVCRGKVNVYAPRGNYSLIIDPEHCEPEGIGALKLAFEQLKKKLKAEGLFESSRKKPMPFLPRRIGIVTAPTGAAIRDMIHVLTRRCPNIEILLQPARVQGEGAREEIARGIEVLNELGNLDVIIIGRGGGSMEDLWAFNEEIVARAIADSKIPIISAVGHEIDFTISDFVADMRAATPSAAAELIVPVRAELKRAIADAANRLVGGLRHVIENRRLELGRLEARLGDPSRRLPDIIQRVDGMRERIVYSLGMKIKQIEQHLAKLASNLDHLSPLGVLAKGYAVVEGPDGRAIRSASRLKVGDDLNVRLHEGSAEAKVKKVLKKA